MPGAPGDLVVPVVVPVGSSVVVELAPLDLRMMRNRMRKMTMRRMSEH